MSGIGATSGYGSQYYYQQEAEKWKAEQKVESQNETARSGSTTSSSGYGSQYDYSDSSSSTQSDSTSAYDYGYIEPEQPDVPVSAPISVYNAPTEPDIPTSVYTGGYAYDYGINVEPSPLDPINNPADIARIAEQNAPILILPEGANDNLPASAQDFIDSSRLREDRSWRTDKEHGNNTNNNTDDDFTGADLADAPDNYFLDLDNDQRRQLGRGVDDPAPLYYELDLESSPPMLTYFVFYAYNDGPSVQNHEGDWERISLELDPETFEPTTARLSAHGHRTDVPVNDITDPVTGRPVIYVAAGSHAAFPAAGVYDTEVEVFKDRTVENPDGVPFRELGNAVIYDSWGGLENVQEQAWYPTAGNNGVRWGEIGEFDATSGPQGPSTEKGFVDNPVWGEDEDGFWGKLADNSRITGAADSLGSAVEGGHDIAGTVYDAGRTQVQERSSWLSPVVDWVSRRDGE